MEIQDLLNQLGQELKNQQDNNDSRINYLLNERNFNVIISEFYDGCQQLTEVKCKMLENVGMSKEAILHKRKINSKTGLPENKIIYST